MVPLAAINDAAVMDSFLGGINDAAVMNSFSMLLTTRR